IAVSGDLIGCFCCGPGPESSTWGLPESAQLWIKKTHGDSEFPIPLAGNEDKFEMIGSIDGGGGTCGDCNMQTHIPTGWQIQGTVPALDTDFCYQVTVRFIPMCGWLPSGSQMPGDVSSFNDFCVTSGGGGATPTPSPGGTPVPTDTP